MGDHRLSVEMSLVGVDGKTHKREMWVNWWPTKPSEVFDMVVKLAREAGLEVDDYYQYEHQREEADRYRELLDRIELLVLQEKE